MKVKVTQSCPTLCYPTEDIVHGILQARILEWVAFPLLQGIFPTQGSNSGIPHCRWTLDQLNHKGNQRILEWVAYSFSSGFSWPRNQTGVSCIAGKFFTNWAMREALNVIETQPKGCIQEVFHQGNQGVDRGLFRNKPDFQQHWQWKSRIH